MSYITTYTGKHFDPVNPDASLLCIEDIAHALSLLGTYRPFSRSDSIALPAQKKRRHAGYQHA